MAGNKIGGLKSYHKNIENQGADWYARIGELGGAKGTGGGFAYGEQGRKRARIWGAIGGAMSRRTNHLSLEEREKIKQRMLTKYDKNLANLMKIQEQARKRRAGK